MQAIVKKNDNQLDGLIKFCWLLFFQLRASFPLLSIWKAWQWVYNCLSWKSESLQHGFSFGVSSIWWNKMVQYQGQPLAIAFSRHALLLFNKGIQQFGDLWDFNTLDWVVWHRSLRINLV